MNWRKPFTIFLPTLFSLYSSANAFYVVLDPGHGGKDHGIKKEELSEKELVLDIAKRVESLLSSRPDLTVVLTRKEDYTVSFNDRRKTANSRTPGLYLSLHFAAASNLALHDPRIYTLSWSSIPSPSQDLFIPFESAHEKYATESSRWAYQLRDSFLPFFPSVEIRVSPLPLSPLMGITLPAALIEFDYLTSTNAQKWKESATLDQAAQIVVAAIDRFQMTGNNPSP